MTLPGLLFHTTLCRTTPCLLSKMTLADCVPSVEASSPSCRLLPCIWNCRALPTDTWTCSSLFHVKTSFLKLASLASYRWSISILPHLHFFKGLPAAVVPIYPCATNTPPVSKMTSRPFTPLKSLFVNITTEHLGQVRDPIQSLSWLLSRIGG